MKEEEKGSEALLPRPCIHIQKDTDGNLNSYLLTTHQHVMF